MRSIFLKYLDDKHIIYDASDPLLVSFSLNGLNYLMMYDHNDDPNYIRFCLPDIEPSEINDEIRKKMIRINSEYKVAKIIEIEGHVWISGESFVFNYLSVQNLFDRMLILLQNVLSAYRNA